MQRQWLCSNQERHTLGARRRGQGAFVPVELGGGNRVKEAVEVDGWNFGGAAGCFDGIDMGDYVVQGSGRERLAICQLDKEGNNGDLGRVAWGKGSLAYGCRAGEWDKTGERNVSPSASWTKCTSMGKYSSSMRCSLGVWKWNCLREKVEFPTTVFPPSTTSTVVPKFSKGMSCCDSISIFTKPLPSRGIVESRTMGD